MLFVVSFCTPEANLLGGSLGFHRGVKTKSDQALAMKKMEKAIEIHRKWLLRTKEILPSWLEHIENDLKSPSIESFQFISDSLAMLAAYYGVKGEVAAYDENPRAWEDISRSLKYRHLSLTIKFEIFHATRFLNPIQATDSLTNQLSTAACLLSAFLTIGDRSLADSAAKMLHYMLTVKGVINENFLKSRGFEPFMLWLYSALYEDSQFRLPLKTDLGAYQEMVDQWSSTSPPDNMFEKLKTYHFNNNVDKGGAWNPEFKHAPFDLIAFEISAIGVVRDKLDLPKLPLNYFRLRIHSAPNR